MMTLLRKKVDNLEEQLLLVNTSMSSGYSLCASLQSTYFFLYHDDDNESYVTDVWRFVVAVSVGKDEFFACCEKFSAER